MEIDLIAAAEEISIAALITPEWNFDRKQRTALKVFLPVQRVFALLLTGFGKKFSETPQSMTASHGGARLRLLSPARTNRNPSATLAVKHLFGVLECDRQMVRLISVQVSPRCTNAFYGLCTTSRIHPPRQVTVEPRRSENCDQSAT